MRALLSLRLRHARLSSVHRRRRMNSSAVTHFTLSAYVDTGPWRYLFFLVVLCLYVSIVASNVLLVAVICVNRSLHEPMYLFLCSLFVNELFGSTGLLPFLMLHILSDSHAVAAPLCFLQIFCVYTYACVEFFNLAVMSYDRYLAICCPLQYSARMTHSRITVLIALIWFYASVLCLVPLSLTASLRLCGNIMNKVYCDNYLLVKLSCSDTSVNNVYGLVATTFTVSFPVSLILFSYLRILRVCFSGSSRMRLKAVATCSPHLASLLNFSFGCFFEILQSRFDMSDVPDLWRIFLSLYWLVSQPLFCPVMYGLNISRIRVLCKNLFLARS